MGAVIVFLVALPVFLLAFRGVFALRNGGRERVAVALAGMSAFAMAAAALWFECSVWSLLAVACAMAAASAYGDAGRDLFGPATERIGKYRLWIYLLSVFGVALLVFVAIPITTFLTSPGELDIHLDRMLEVNGRNVMVVVYAALAIYSLAFFGKARTVLALASMGAFFLAWVYAFLMPFGYPLMSGLAFEQLPIPLSQVVLRTVVDVAGVLALAWLLQFVLKRWGGKAILGALLMANLSIGIAAGISASREQLDQAGARGEEEAFEPPLRLSTKAPNTLVIFLDRFMGSYVEGILAKDPALAQRLSGFTWYSRSISAGENSIAGVHPMLGGYDYLPVEMNARGLPLRDLSVEAFSILPHNFAERGYRVSMLSPRGMGFTMLGDCEFMQVEGVNCSHIPASISHDKAVQMGFSLSALAESNYGDLLVLLGSMRVAPYLVKEAIYTRGPWQPFLDHSAGTTFREWAELGALDALTEVDDGAPSFNFVSNILPHEPYFMGEDCMPLPRRPALNDEEIRRRGYRSFFSMQHAVAAGCVLHMVADYTDRLKARGVYDNTRIVLVSDHGIVGDVTDQSSRAVAGATTENIFVRLRPLVMVKPPGAQGALQVSEDFVANADVPTIVCGDIGGCVNPYLDNKPIKALGRDDPFPVSIVPWQFSEQRPESFVIKEQYQMSGKDPFVRGNWGRVVPPEPRK